MKGLPGMVMWQVIGIATLSMSTYYFYYKYNNIDDSSLLSASSTLGSIDVSKTFAEQCPCANIESNYVTSEVSVRRYRPFFLVCMFDPIVGSNSVDARVLLRLRLPRNRILEENTLVEFIILPAVVVVRARHPPLNHHSTLAQS